MSALPCGKGLIVRHGANMGWEGAGTVTILLRAWNVFARLERGQEGQEGQWIGDLGIGASGLGLRFTPPTPGKQSPLVIGGQLPHS
jgi:hypothetical protein